MVNLANGMSERGFRIDLVLVDVAGAYLNDVTDPVRIVDLGSRRTLQSMPALARYFRQSKTPLIITAQHHANLAALFARKFLGRRPRIVLTIHNTLSIERANANSAMTRVQHMIMGRCYRWADQIVAVSDASADDFANVTGISRDRIDTIYNPVVTPGLHAAANEPLKDPWFEPGSPPVVLGIGRLSRQKDFVTLIEAFKSLRSRRNARLMILGEGEERESLERLIASTGHENDVRMPGFVQNPYQYLKHAGCFVLSSRWEGLPTVLIEALALDVPIVSTDCPGGPREILSGATNGVLVPVADSRAMCEAIETALDADRHGLADRDWSRFTLSSSVARYVELLGVGSHA